MPDSELYDGLAKGLQAIQDQFVGMKILPSTMWDLRTALRSLLVQNLSFKLDPNDIVVTVNGSNINVDFKGKLREELLALGLIHD